MHINNENRTFLCRKSFGSILQTTVKEDKGFEIIHKGKPQQWSSINNSVD